MDINTIFYFAGSQEEYDNNKLLINSRTISFVPNNDGKTGSIYKAGIKYSGDITDAINTLVKWDGKYHTGTNIGDLIVNGERTPVWVPTSSGGGSGSGSGGGIDVDQQEAIDRLNDTIQRLRDSLEEIKNTADSESERLDNLYINIENSIRDKFGDMLNDANFLESLGDGWYSNFGKDLTDSEIGYYLQMIGAIEEKNGEKIYTWTKIQQEIDKLTLTTKALIRNGNLDENTVEGLYAQLQLTIQDEIARQNLAVGWGQYAEDTKDVLLWMNSQLDQGASKEETWNELVSAAKNNSREAGIADLYTRVRNLETGLLSEAGFNAKVDNAISGIKASTTGEYTSTQIFSRIKLNEDNIAALYTKATGQQVEAGAGVDFEGWTGGFITTANAAEALAGLVSASADNQFKSGIETMVGNAAIGGIASFSAIARADENAAATIIGLINGEYGDYSSEIQIDADRINLNGETWADTLHVTDLIADTIKDSDGNSIQTNYLVEKMSEGPYCYITYSLSFSDVNAASKYDIRYDSDKPIVVQKGGMFSTIITYNNAYSILDSVTVKMGNEDITRRCTYAYGDSSYSRGSLEITVYGVNANVSILIKDLTYTPIYSLRRVDAIPSGNGTSWELTESVAPILLGDTVEYRFDSNDETLIPVSWAVGDTNILDIDVSQGLSTPKFTAKATGSTTVTITTSNISNPTITYTLTVVSSTEGNGIENFGFIIDNVYDTTIKHTAMGVSGDTIGTYVDFEGTAGTYSVLYAVATGYDQYLTISTSNNIGVITAKKTGYAKVTATLTYSGKTYKTSGWVYIAPKMFSDTNAHRDYYVDIFGNSNKPEQIVHANPNVQTIPYTITNYSDSGEPISQTTIIKEIYNGTLVQSQFATYDRTLNKDYHVVFIGGSGTDWLTITKPDWINSVRKAEQGSVGYIAFKCDEYTTAIDAYNLHRPITKDDLYKASRCGNIVITAADGSKLIITVIQSGKYGFYGELKDNIHDVVSASCLTPSYAWNKLTWYSDQELIKTSIYPDSILIPENGYYCVAEAKMPNMPDSAMGTMKEAFGSNPKLTMNK